MGGSVSLRLMQGCGLQDPNMQKMLYPYLPEGMRNPQTFEWMMSNPEYRSQLEKMLEKQVSVSPRVVELVTETVQTESVP